MKVRLIVRDTCRLRPGLAGVSDTITVMSIVGRFLEHARIYYFRNGGDEEYYIGSADLMSRNLESRVEVLVPMRIAGIAEGVALRSWRRNCTISARLGHADRRHLRPAASRPGPAHPHRARNR